MDPDDAINDCRARFCSVPGYDACAALEEYADACAEAAPGVCVEWRRRENCPLMTCAGGWNEILF